MLGVVQDLNPEYPADMDLDAKPLFKIAEFIYKRMAMSGGPENNAYAILPIWEQLYHVVLKDQFYAQKALITIANHIQEFYQKTQYGDHKSAKLNPDKLKRKIAAKYFERKQNLRSDPSEPL